MKTALHWTDLIVSDGEIEYGTLGELVDSGEIPNVDTITFAANGSIDSWRQVFIAAPDEEPEWDTPKCAVDWAGCREAIEGIYEE